MAVKNQKLKTNAMLTPVRKRSRKGVVVVILISVLVLGAAGTVLALNIANQKSSDQSASGQNQSPDQTDMTSGKSTTTAEALGSNNEAENKTPAQYDGENPNNYDSLTGIITFSGVAENKFVISAAIDQYTTGSCKFEATGPNGVVISAENPIMAGPTSSFCSYSGDIPSVAGKYNIVITLTSDNKTGTITGEVEI